MLLIYTTIIVFSNTPSNNVGLQLNAFSFDEGLLSNDPFKDAEFIKSVQVRGNTRASSLFSIVKNVNGKTSNFSMAQNSFVLLNGRISRTLNFNFVIRFNSSFLGFQDNYGNAEDQTIQGVANTGTGGGSIALQERTSIGDFTFGLESAIIYYAGILTYSNPRSYLINTNFRSAPRLIAPAAGFSIYERQFNSTGLSAQPQVLATGAVRPYAAKGIKLLYQSKGGTGVNSFSFVGINRTNLRILRRQIFSTTFFNRTFKTFNVNIFGKRAKYELALNNQLTTGINSLVNGLRLNYYVHSFTLGRRTNEMGITISAEPFQPEYEIAYMRSVLPIRGSIEKKHQSIAKGIILKNAFSGSIIGINPLLVRVNMYHVDSGYVNPNGGFLNTSAISFDHNPNGRNRIRRATFDHILPIDGIANNRQGINFQYGYDFYNVFGRDAIRITGGNEISRQIVRSTRGIIANPLGASVVRTDIDATGRPAKKLHFSAFECDVKYLGKIKGKDMYIQNYFLSYTTKPDFHLLPDFSNQSYVRSFKFNTSFYYHISEGIVPNFTFNYVRSRGNANTVLFTNYTPSVEGTYSPIDVISKGFATGLNIHLNRDYLLALSYNYGSNRNLAFKNSKQQASHISFNLVYNFRAT